MKIETANKENDDDEICSQKHSIKGSDEQRTPWPSVCLSFLVQTLNGIQFSIYITSMWPYLTTLEPNAGLSFFGWIMSIYSIGQMFSSWIFGFWNQKTMSTKHPAAFGLAFTALGNVIYGLLPLLPSYQAWFMLMARFLAGFGSGTLSVIRSYCAMASVAKDRAKVMSLAVGSFVLGLSLGPSIQSIFIPIGKDGISIGPIILNMYTAPAFLMVFISLGSIFLLMFCFVERYSGIISSEEKSDPYLVIPKFDRIAAVVCIYLYFLLQLAGTSLEVMSTPLTISLYNWPNAKALFYNGTLQTIACSIDIVVYLLISFSRLGSLDKRIMLLISLSCFIIYQIFTLPWPFYEGPLDYIELGNFDACVTYSPNSTVEDTAYSGGCYRRYAWCAHTKRVPLPIYAFGYTIVLAIAFPFLAAPVGILFSEVLGPRKQGVMQGVNEIGGCIARCITPIIQSMLFESSGYIFPVLMNLTLLAAGLLSMIVFYGRMTPLKMKPNIGVATPYKKGVFYRF
ncbi:unnamed protein product [Enterobius vermicularis]|uniref:MFS domain-containing protein n=1 Tax=Enterobius vermicularis TaxID=51028 RepID=A0A0N4VBY4_ENTVE|nr:unnamed protein product [Enterobius vermicularis]